MDNSELIKDLSSAIKKVNDLANTIVLYEQEIEKLSCQLTEKDLLLDQKISKLNQIRSLIENI